MDFIGCGTTPEMTDEEKIRNILIVLEGRKRTPDMSQYGDFALRLNTIEAIIKENYSVEQYETEGESRTVYTVAIAV
jgi:hypothetical protein